MYDLDIGPTGDLYLITWDQQIVRIDKSTGLISIKYNAQKGSFNPSSKPDLAVASDNEIYYTNGMDPKVYLVSGGTRSDYVWDNGASSTAEGTFKNTYPPRYPSSVTYNPAVPNLYFADRDNSRIKFVAMGIDRIYTKIGNGVSSFLEGIDADNLAITLPVLCEYDISSHSIFFRERDFQGVRVLLPTNKVFNFTGIGTAGYSGDGFAATSASLNNSSAVAVDSRGNVYIADSGNHALRMVIGGALP